MRQGGVRVEASGPEESYPLEEPQRVQAVTGRSLVSRPLQFLRGTREQLLHRRADERASKAACR